MWVVEYIIEDLMDFFFSFFFDLGSTGSIKCCKLSFSLSGADWTRDLIITTVIYPRRRWTGKLYRRSQGEAVRDLPFIDLTWREIT